MKALQIADFSHIPQNIDLPNNLKDLVNEIHALNLELIKFLDSNIPISEQAVSIFEKFVKVRVEIINLDKSILEKLLSEGIIDVITNIYSHFSDKDKLVRLMQNTLSLQAEVALQSDWQFLSLNINKKYEGCVMDFAAASLHSEVGVFLADYILTNKIEGTKKQRVFNYLKYYYEQWAAYANLLGIWTPEPNSDFTNIKLVTNALKLTMKYPHLKQQHERY